MYQYKSMHFFITYNLQQTALNEFFEMFGLSSQDKYNDTNHINIVKDLTLKWTYEYQNVLATHSNLHRHDNLFI